MELQFKRTAFSCLDPVLQEVQNMELTQELRLGDSMPDIGNILCAWGQPILRSKEWRGDGVSFSGGMMVWVLYTPEDGTRELCIDGWIPFQMKWDLPESVPEGSIRIHCLPRFVDARSVSPRKIMVRSGVAAMAEAFVPMEAETYLPERVPEAVEMLRTLYPVRIPKEAGEKTFLLDEELTLPGAVSGRESVICYHLEPKLTDRKVLGNKVVFRGNGNLHIVYRDEGGRLRSWNYEIPFSQFDELEKDYGTDAQPDFVLSPTSLELEPEEQGQLRFRGGITAQYLVTDKQLLELIEDAYSTDRELQMQTRTVELPAVLETRRENIYGEQTISADAGQVADVRFWPDFPRQRRGENGIELEYPGQFQALYYGEDGMLRSGTVRWEGKQTIPADGNSVLTAVPVPGEQPQGIPGGGQIRFSGESALEMTTTVREHIPMVTGLELGETRQPDPGRPSLILRRAGDSRLWDIAKESSSTIAAIRRANSLQEEPVPGQMLLIPVL